ncbi:DUF1516 family protein [Philodulcilactobacillus myokoensis]|uniref:DUF1516 family protein n=1 Tax=Philodulcilactobacillus myokoensis TaxID=2929573 RepID=UPI0025705C0F|nr:DUF1516 family protein [Philodulcilactobacillus myokoensis]
MRWITINLTCWFLLMISNGIGLNLHSEKRMIQSMIWSRLFYCILIISQVILTIRMFAHHPWLVIICDLIVLILIPVVETNYRFKEQSKINHGSVILLCICSFVFIFLQILILN